MNRVIKYIIIIIYPDISKSDQNQELVNWNSIKLDKNELDNHNKSNEEICIDNHTEPKKSESKLQHIESL